MHIGYFAYQLPLWACIALALLPPMLLVLFFRLLPHRFATDDTAKAKHQIVVSLLSTAFVFSVTLSTNTVWSEDQKIYDSANHIVQTNLAILDQVGYAAPDQLSVGQEHFRNLLEALPDDINEESIAASPESKQQMRVTQQWIASLKLSGQDKEAVDALAQTLQQEWYAWLVAINASGLPDIVWLTLAVVVALLLAAVSLMPMGNHQRYETLLVFSFGLGVGILQVPLWVLNSQGFTDALAGSVFNEFTQTAPSFGRLLGGIVFALLLATLFYLVLHTLDRRHSRRYSDTGTPTDQEADASG